MILPLQQDIMEFYHLPSFERELGGNFVHLEEFPLLLLYRALHGMEWWDL